MHFPSTIATGASLLTTAVFIGPALTAPPKHIWTNTPSGFGDSIASLETRQILVPTIAHPLRATPPPVSDRQNGIRTKRSDYCPYHKDYAKYQACIAIGQADKVKDHMDNSITWLTQVSEPIGEEGCLEDKDHARFTACYVIRILGLAELALETVVKTLRQVSVGPHDVQPPWGRRSMRAVSGDDQAVAGGEGFLTTDEAAMITDGEGGSTTNDEDEATTWYEDEAEEKIQGIFAHLLTHPPPATRAYNNDEEEKIQEIIAHLLHPTPATRAQFPNATASGSTDSAPVFRPPPPLAADLAEDKCSLQLLSDFLTSRDIPVDPVVRATVQSWADHFSTYGALTPEAAYALGVNTKEDTETQKRQLKAMMKDIMENYDAWKWWLDDLPERAKNSPGN